MKNLTQREQVISIFEFYKLLKLKKIVSGLFIGGVRRFGHCNG